MTSTNPTPRKPRARASRRMFGGIRKLPSGRFQVRYLDQAVRRQLHRWIVASCEHQRARSATSDLAADLLGVNLR